MMCCLFLWDQHIKTYIKHCVTMVCQERRIAFGSPSFLVTMYYPLQWIVRGGETRTKAQEQGGSWSRATGESCSWQGGEIRCSCHCWQARAHFPLLNIKTPVQEAMDAVKKELAIPIPALIGQKTWREERTTNINDAIKALVTSFRSLTTCRAVQIHTSHSVAPMVVLTN